MVSYSTKLNFLEKGLKSINFGFKELLWKEAYTNIDD
jgi:hypothetical protein